MTAEDGTSRQDAVQAAVQLLRTQAKFTQRMLRALSRHGLTGPQFDVLTALHGAEGIMQQELAGRLRVTRGNVTGVVDRMEALGWIERRADPGDRRTRRLFLTAEGRATFAAAQPEHRALVHAFMADFGADEVRTLTRLLRKLEDGIEK